MSSEADKTRLSTDLLNACIHCGMCLPACPTYLATGREMESPRGRIYLLNEWNRGNLELNNRLAGHIESCLGCLGCETACPSGVQYGHILDEARVILAQKHSRFSRMLARFAFANILPNYGLLRALTFFIRVFQQSHIMAWLQKHTPFKRFFGILYRSLELLPEISPYKTLSKVAWLSGAKVNSVNLFTGCVMDVFYNNVNQACQNLLVFQRNVVHIPAQTCCGALACHAGEMDIAKKMAKRNIEYFENVSGPIVVTAAGCSAMLKEYAHLLADDSQWCQRAQTFSRRVQDITESLVSGSFAKPPISLNKKVAYHAACHLAHAQGVHTVVGELLTPIKDLEVVALTEAEHCCGSAGIYNLTQPVMSDKILERKIENIQSTGVDELVTTNPGCMLQIQAGLSRCGSHIKVRHLAELLAEAYRPQF